MLVQQRHQNYALTHRRRVSNRQPGIPSNCPRERVHVRMVVHAVQGIPSQIPGRG